MKKCLKTFNDYQLSNKIINMAIILVLAISYIFIVSMMLADIKINYFLIIPMLVFLTSSSFFCTEGDNKNMNRYIIFYIIFLILFFLLPLFSEQDYFVSLFSYTVCMIPAVLLTTEAVKYEGLTSFYFRVKDYISTRKELHYIKSEYKITGIKNTTTKYSIELDNEKTKLLESLEEDYQKEKILLENLIEDLKKEKEIIISKQEKLVEKMNATITKLKRKLTGFERYHLLEVQKNQENEMEIIKKELLDKENAIDDVIANEDILDKTYLSESNQINLDYQIRHDKCENLINKNLKLYENSSQLVKGEN